MLHFTPTRLKYNQVRCIDNQKHLLKIEGPMKKIIMLIVCTTIICALVFCNYIQPLALDYSFNQSGYPPIFSFTPSSIYFANLSTNFPRNIYNSCGYSAITMLLSYYDSFVDDRFIPENYDAPAYFILDQSQETIRIFNSPGVRKEPSFSPTSIEEYNAFLEGLYDTHFQSFLINFGKQYGINQHLSYICNDYGLFDYQMENLLSKYLYDEIGFAEDEVYVFYFSSTGLNSVNIREMVIENLSKNIPVIYSGKNESNESHSCIVYDYDATNDMLYFNTGFEGNGIVSEANYEYTINPTILFIIVNEAYLPHSHSNNYIRQDTQAAVCSCAFEFHPHHTHTNTGEYLSHTITSHTLGCLYCDGITAPHNSVYTPLSSMQHRVDCACGYTSIGVHISRRGENFCMACGSPISNSQVILGIDTPVQPMQNYSSYATYETHLSENGTIILSEFDYNLYVAGELTIQEIYRKVGLIYG